VNRKVTDVRRTLSYSHETMARRFLIIGALAFLIGLYGMFNAHDFARQPMYWLGLVAGGFCLGYGFYRTAMPGKLLELSPAGIRLHIDMVKYVLIPWHEIQAVERTDNVTVVLVSQTFYDRVIHVDSALLRGPGWDSLFAPRDGMVQVALPHQLLPVTADALHAAVLARWTAFGDAGRAMAGAKTPAAPRAQS
jgi:hypothetical protein